MTCDRSERRKLLGFLTAPAGMVGIGSFVPGNVMLIGEQASSPTTAPNQEPFCGTLGCSGWLNKLLDQYAIPEEKLFWVNALNNDGSKLDLRPYQELKPVTVIALGKIAGDRCHEQSIPYRQYPHPQYWKRFKSKQEYPLLPDLKQLVENIRPVNFDVRSYKYAVGLL